MVAAATVASWGRWLDVVVREVGLNGEVFGCFFVVRVLWMLADLSLTKCEKTRPSRHRSLPLLVAYK